MGKIMRLKAYETTGNVTQSVSVTVHLRGNQHPKVDAHGIRGPGSYVSVTADHIAVYVYDQRAMRSYCEGWIDTAALARMELPELAEPFGTGPETLPGIIVRAHGHDRPQHVYDPQPGRQQLMMTIGQVRWIIHDRQAYRSMTAAWRQARDLGMVVLGER